jgi:hypothetical protein
MITKALFLAKDPNRIAAPILHDHGPGHGREGGALIFTAEAWQTFLGTPALVRGPDVAPGATALAGDLSIDMLVLSSYWARQRPPSGGTGVIRGIGERSVL